MLVHRDQSPSILALIDSGADGSFVDRKVAKQMGIETEPLDCPLEAKALNRMPLTLVKHRTEPITHYSLEFIRQWLDFTLPTALTPHWCLSNPGSKRTTRRPDWTLGKINSWMHFCHSQSAFGPRCPLYLTHCPCQS